MNISEIIETLDKWNFWNQKIKTGFSRPVYFSKLKKYLKMPEVVALTGVRRSGKSTLILQLIENLIKKGTDPQNTLYINFEEPNFSGELDVKFLTKIFESYLEFYRPRGKVYLFLDEIQLVPEWERFVASLYDRKIKVKIFITGSSSRLLMGEISTLLGGRYVSEVIYPLSFREFLEFRKEKYSPLVKSPKLFGLLREYIEFGGFPRVVIEKEKYTKRVVLAEYFNSILERDVLFRNKIRNTREVREVINFTLSNIAGPISTYRMEKNFGISSQNISRYFDHFSEAFLMIFAPYFSYSVKKQIYNPQKVFAIDTGLVNVASFKFSDNMGKLLENVVAMELVRRKRELYYWEEKKEIDFVLRDGYKVSELINVCYSLNNSTLKREITSLKAGREEFKDSKLKIIYWEGSPPDNSEIEFINILDFLLK